jgi:hypothetical protein
MKPVLSSPGLSVVRNCLFALVGILSAPALNLHPNIGPLYAQDDIGVGGEEGEDDFDSAVRDPILIAYISFDGTADAYGPRWTDRSLCRAGSRPMPYGFADGVVGQARAKGPHGYAGVAYPLPGTVSLDEGTLSLWFRWDKDTEKGPFGNFISPDVFPLAVDHGVFKPIRCDEKWHHVVLTWKRKEAAGKVYLDTNEALTVQIPKEWSRQPRLDENGNPLPISHEVFIAQGLPGRVDEVYLWDMVLKEEEIQRAFDRGRKGETSWPKEALPKPKPWRPHAGLLALGDQRKARHPALSLDKAPRRESAARTYFSLDGVWRCQPLGLTRYVPTSMVEDKGLHDRRRKVAEWWPVPDGWIDMAVPGTWKAAMDPAPLWQASPVTAYYGAVCERDIEIPANLAGKGLFLRIAGQPFRYSRTPFPIGVFVNREFVGESMAGEGAALDLSDRLKPGEQNRLALLLGYPTYPMEQITLGHVTLEAHAARDAAVEFVYVTPCDAPERLELVVEMTKSVKGDLPVQFECVVWDWPDGKEKKSLGTKAVTIPADGQPWHSVSFDLPSPHRWNPEDPHLYNLIVRAAHPGGRLIDEAEPVRFGFRTLAVSGRDMLLNGKPFHMRGMSHNSPGPGEGGFAYKKSIGQNADRCLSEYLAGNRDAALDACDREGWLQCYHIDFSPYWRESESIGEREMFWGIMKTAWNHPSVIAWFPFGNGYVNGPHGHPRQIGGLAGKDFDTDNDWYRQARAYSDALHRNVPGRLTFFYRLGVGGDFRGIMHYMGWGTPIQSHEEWPSYWHEHCNEPFSLTEGGLPMFSNDYLWQWGRGRGKTAFSGSTAIIEHGARYFGDAMYDFITRDMAITLDFTDHGREIEGVEAVPLGDVNPDFLDKMPTGAGSKAEADFGVGDIDDAVMADGGKSKTGIPLGTHSDTTKAYTEKAGTDGPKGRWDFDFTPVDIHQTPAYWTLKGFSARRILCTWRTYGIGYLIHCCFKRQVLGGDGPLGLSPLGHTIRRYNSPLLLYVGGPPGDFVRKDHAFTSGETIARQIIVRNDHYSPAKVAAKWRIIDLADERELANGKADFTVDVGALHQETISFPAPETDRKRRLRIIVSYTENGQERPDETADVQVFPKKPPFAFATAKVGLIDPAGDTAALLKRVGQPFQAVGEGMSLDGLDLLIIGRRGYTEEARNLLGKLNAREAILKGLNVIVFEQTARWVMGLLNEHFASRNAFVRENGAGLLAGLESEDFAEWRSESDILTAYPDWDRKSDWTGGKYSKHGTANEFGQGRFYHWSNKGMVCSFAYNKPQVGNFRILLDTSFDLLYTPLLEERIGDGRVLFCQLDVTNRYGSDPVASVLVDRILAEYSIKRPTAKMAVGYLGGPEGKKLVDPLGLECREVTDPAKDLPGLGILIVSAQEAAKSLKEAKAAVEAFLKSGGKVLVLPVTAETDLAWLPAEVKRTQGEPFITRNIRESPLLRGLAVSDFFWRRCIRCVQVSSEAEGAWNADSGLVCAVPLGKGEVVFCQIEPTWFEWTWQQGKVTRIWATILRNMGASSSLSVNPVCADDSAFKQIYHVPPLPFDPDGHRVW